jgi:serine phosphatase RsbU (regulator of sigma subunit)
MKLNTIYKQLLVNIVFPLILGLLLIGIFSYNNTRKILEDNKQTEKVFIYDEIRSFIELQFVALSIIEEPVENQMHTISNQLVNNYFKSTKEIEAADLNKIMKDLGLDNEQFDLYIINQDGIVVNTTFNEDLYINFFSFGKEHKRYLQDVFEEGEFSSPRFFFEHKTKRYKKYSYHPTLDGKYIVEIGTYSEQADKIYDFTINHLIKIPEQQANIKTIDLFFWADKPYPLNLNRNFFKEHLGIIQPVVTGKSKSVDGEVPEFENTRFTYLYLESNKRKIFDGVIIRIESDNSGQTSFIIKEGIKILILVISILIAVFVLINYRARLIVSPVKELIALTNNIIKGDLNQQIIIEGHNEISDLAQQFNKMADRLLERNVQIEEQQEFLYQSNRKLNQAYKLLDHQKQLIENKQDDLKASINYAQRIQGSLLPPHDAFLKYFEDSFIYMLPRDIVSGDFYWFSKNRNKAIVVAADCTGHGVPGAFMSMIGVTVLHQLVNYQHIFDPAVILSRLDSQINELLVYNKAESDQRFEGMDVSICSIDFETNSLTFASAQRPIILIRKGHATTYKGSIYPIGEYYDDIQKVFHNVQIELQEDDVVYMFSDGYTSQFNEESTKKFNYNRFRKLLSDIQNKKLKEQPAILHRTLEAWKGGNDQIDDILVMGFRYKKHNPIGISAQKVISEEI